MTTRPCDRLLREAKQNPGGWVYEIAGDYAANEAVPPHAIKGVWKVDERGELTGEYLRNPNFHKTHIARLKYVIYLVIATISIGASLAFMLLLR